jgi:hexosaminidase
MEKENLKTYADVQIYFTNRISNFIEKKGYRMMGWNEIMGNVHVTQKELINNKALGENELNAKIKLAPNSIIHFWKGDSLLLIDALNKGYDVVNSKSIYTYLDYPVARTSISKAYHFSPVPKGISNQQASHILGLGCQMWGEVTPRAVDVYQYTFPRIAAYAEVGWTYEQNKDFDRFTRALEKMKKYWDKKGIYYFEE